MMPWVQPSNSSWYRAVLCHKAPCGTNLSSLAYQGAWAELMFHLGLSSIEKYLWYRAGDEWITEGIENLTAVLEELDTVTGRRSGGWQHCLHAVVDWQDTAIISGIESATGLIFRYSPRDMAAVTVIAREPATFRIAGKTVIPVPGGVLLQLLSTRGTHGFWISTAGGGGNACSNV
eukprot:COSAG05_NODE_1795_length_4077_cov_2.741830_7_plen_176_part_00